MKYPDADQESIENRKQSSNFQSFVNTCKLVFGNAYLSIPNVFSLTGWVGGIVLFSVVGSLNIYTMIQNLDLHDRYPATHSYSEIGLKVLGSKGKIVVDISIWLMQLSVCCSYLYFIAE
jgi:amino acid permease